MKRTMTKADIRAWIDRWKLVNEFVIQEARALSPEDRFRELDFLFRSRGLFRWPTDEQAGIPEVRRRWLRLKRSPRAR